MLCEAIQSVFRQILTTHTNRKVDGFIICYDITQEKKDLLEYSFMIVKNRPMQVFQAIVLVGMFSYHVFHPSKEQKLINQNIEKSASPTEND